MIPRALIRAFQEKSGKGTLEGLFLGAFFLGLILSFYPVGFLTSMIQVTRSGREFSPALLLRLLGSWTGGMFLWEAAFRGLILRNLLDRLSWKKAFCIQLLILNAVVIPALWPQAAQFKEMGVFRFFLEENLIECFWALFFLRTGSVLATALVHGIYNVIRFEGINSAAGPFKTFYFFKPASGAFYGLMLGAASLTVLLQFCINQTLGMRELKPSSKPL